MSSRVLCSFQHSLDKNEIALENVIESQIHQQIKPMLPTNKIIIVTALDIINELISICSQISQNHIRKKLVDKNFFVYMLKILLRIKVLNYYPWQTRIKVIVG